jgi:hypothetical protein
MAIRAASHRGGRLLEKLLNADDGGYQGSGLPCGHGHSARFVEYRKKRLLTVLNPVEVRRAYYYGQECGEGVIPKDRELDMVGTGCSPGVRRMMGQVGGREPFEAGRKDLEVLADLRVTTQAMERVAEAVGEQIEQQNQREQAQVLGARSYLSWTRPGYPSCTWRSMPAGCRWWRGRPKDAKAKTKPASPRRERPSWGVPSSRRRWTRRDTRYGMRNPPLRLGRSRRRSPSAPACMPRPSGAASHGRRRSSCGRRGQVDLGHRPGALSRSDRDCRSLSCARTSGESSQVAVWRASAAIPAVAFRSPR